MDKSATHYKIVKNGVSGWLNKRTVDEIGKESLEKNEGYIFLSETPPEVTVIRQKQMERQEVKPEEVIKTKSDEVDIDEDLISPAVSEPDANSDQPEVRKRGRPKSL